MIRGKGLAEVLALYPDRVPVRVTGTALREESKLMVSRSTEVNSFIGLLRSRGLLDASGGKRAQFLIAGDTLAVGGRTFGELYDARPDPAVISLDVVVCEENTFGAFPLAHKMYAGT